MSSVLALHHDGFCVYKGVCWGPGGVQGDVLANTTSIGMHPEVSATPVAASALQHFKLVFDAVYTPMQTQLLKVSKGRALYLAILFMYCMHQVSSSTLSAACSGA